MRLRFIVLLLTTNCCFAQRGLQLEIMPGVAGYQGDLTQKTVPFNTIGPSAALNIKYDFGDMVILRTGFAWGKVSAKDNDNKDTYLNNRNLSFETMIWEGHLGAEINILDPEAYYSLPYVFTGIALFHFGNSVFIIVFKCNRTTIAVYFCRKINCVGRLFLFFIFVARSKCKTNKKQGCKDYFLHKLISKFGANIKLLSI